MKRLMVGLIVALFLMIGALVAGAQAEEREDEKAVSRSQWRQEQRDWWDEQRQFNKRLEGILMALVHHLDDLNKTQEASAQDLAVIRDEVVILRQIIENRP